MGDRGDDFSQLAASLRQQKSLILMQGVSREYIPFAEDPQRKTAW